LHFIVFETNRYGMALDMQGTVTQESQVEHFCSVVVPSTFDLSSAQLQVDGIPFDQLPPRPPPVETKGKMHTTSLESLRKEHGVSVPYKVNDSHLDQAPSPPPKPTPATSSDWSSPAPKMMPLQPEAPAKPFVETPGAGLAHWLGEIKGIWHACYGNMRMPSEEGLPENNIVHSHSRSYNSGIQGGAHSSSYGLAHGHHAAPPQPNPHVVQGQGQVGRSYADRHPPAMHGDPYATHGPGDPHAMHAQPNQYALPADPKSSLHPAMRGHAVDCANGGSYVGHGDSRYYAVQGGG